MKSLLLLLFYSLNILSKYSDYEVIRCLPTTQFHLNKLKVYENLGWDFWISPSDINNYVDICIQKTNQQDIFNTLTLIGITCEVHISNLQTLINEEKIMNNNNNPSINSVDTYFNSYQSYQNVYNYLDNLVSLFPDYAKVSSIGSTYLGKPIKIITLSLNPNENKPILWFDGGIHAREWITVTTVMYMADKLLRNYKPNVVNNITSILNNFDVIICPIINVDGYDYTWTTNRLWRKTRSVNSGTSCVGTDPNRNFNFHWGEAGSSTSPCSDVYQGNKAASEIEVQTLQSTLWSLKDRIVGYVNFHSYSQLWMYSWGYTSALPPSNQMLSEVSKLGVAAIQAKYGTVYKYGPIYTTIYPASGGAVDYAYGVCGIPYSFTIELRDTGSKGFVLPTSDIIPTAEETFDGVIVLANYIKSKLVPTQSPTISPTSPTFLPTIKPTYLPTNKPSIKLTSSPTNKPSLSPTLKPSTKPSLSPTKLPTRLPTKLPTSKPTLIPSSKPTVSPTRSPTVKPTIKPSTQPSVKPT